MRSRSRTGRAASRWRTEPDSDTFVLGADTYVQPSSQIGHKAHVQLIIDDETVAQTEIRTWLVP